MKQTAKVNPRSWSEQQEEVRTPSWHKLHCVAIRLERHKLHCASQTKMKSPHAKDSHSRETITHRKSNHYTKIPYKLIYEMQQPSRVSHSNQAILPQHPKAVVVLNLCSTTPPLCNCSLFQDPPTLNKLQKQMYLLVDLLIRLACCRARKGSRPPRNLLTPSWGGLPPVKNHCKL